MFERVVPDVLAAYGVSYRQIGQSQKGYRNESYPVYLQNGTVINLIFFKREAHIVQRITRADTVSQHALTHGLPVRTRYDLRLIKVKAEIYAGLYSYLPGQTIAWEMYSMKHIKLLGNSMGDLHAALASLLRVDDYSIDTELINLIKTMKEYFSRTGVRHAAKEKSGLDIATDLFDTYEQFVRSHAALPGRQMIHMDMVRGNVLFDTAQAGDKWQISTTTLSGVIDFEKAGWGLPVHDVARTLAFLLVDCAKPAARVRKYFIASGYKKRAGQSLKHEQLLDGYVGLFLLHDLYKFMRHTPYESLHKNHHYKRTINLLYKYGMISITHK